jgi:hypothetical protein
MNTGGVFIIYSKELVGPKYNFTDWLDRYLSSSVDTRAYTINNHTAIIIDGKAGSEVFLFYNTWNERIKTMVNIISDKQDIKELIKIA